MDMTYTEYNIDGWYVKFPQEWKFSLDQNQQPPQIVIEVEEEPVSIYISTWSWRKPETAELPDVKTVSTFFLQAFEQQGVERLVDYSKYYPEGFSTYIGKSITEDGNMMISCAVCAEGRALSIYFVCDKSVEFEKYLKYVKLVELE